MISKRVGSFVATLLLAVLACGTAMASAGGEGGGSDWKDFFLRLLNLAVMLAILVKLLKKPATNFFVSRRENIQRLLKELEEKKQEAAARAEEYKSKLAVLDKETERILEEYIQEGEAERRKIIEAAERQAEYIRQQAQFAIQQEIKSAKESLKEEIADLTVSAAEELLKKNIRGEDQKRLVEDFMTKAVEAK